MSMPAYHQMGHDSWNLLAEPRLSAYAGVVLSPVNDTEERMCKQLATLAHENLEIVFDPQLYYPRSDRGKLPDWAYYPSDVDTADQSSLNWWAGNLSALGESVGNVGANSVCSPAGVPRSFSDSYYSLNCEICEATADRLAPQGLSVLQTVLVNLRELAVPERPAAIASIVSRASAERVYLVVVSDIEPRREIRDTDALKGVTRLIRYLQGTGIRVLVGFVSSDIVLWKAAQAADCATGKFFNLRRFTPSRFEPPAEGGGQIPYWFEESLMGFLREADLLRIRNGQLLSETSQANPFAVEILSTLDDSPGQPWLAASWRQYMHWFADIEARLASSEVDPRVLLRDAEAHWMRLEDNDILMEEPRNDGGWLRPWRRALAEALR